MSEVLLSTELPLPSMHRGKVRDIYAVGDRLLFVTTDRLSAFDVVLNEGIPGKGRCLTALSVFWAERLPAAHPYHLISTEPEDLGPALAPFYDLLRGRMMLVEQLEMFPVECVVRGFLVGSGWKDYQATGSLCGHPLPPGLQNGDPLETLLFTPATKAAVGDHDENISYDAMVARVGIDVATELRDRSLALFRQGQAYARERGLILVDTKFEFGRRADGTVVLADEVLTSDSSRYWDAAEAAATPRGQTPPSFDKQIVRDHLETTDWNKKHPAPSLPAGIVTQTADRYQTLIQRLEASP